MITAVADSGPLIHLYEIGVLELLNLFELQIPDAVWEETVGRDRIPAHALSNRDHLQKQTLDSSNVESFVAANGLETLQRGEQECLCLCQLKGISLLLTDDLAVRDMAKGLGLIAVGSLGIVVRAFRAGLISHAQATTNLNALFDTSSLFVTRTIVELALEQLNPPN